jgi:hypothetical protein
MLNRGHCEFGWSIEREWHGPIALSGEATNGIPEWRFSGRSGLDVTGAPQGAILVGAVSGERLVVANDIAGAIRKWFGDHSFVNVELREQLCPPSDPQDDYNVTHEMVFEPTASNVMRLEIWLTDDGFSAVGLERKSRIAKRLGTSVRRDGFAVGNEPCALSISEIISILELVFSWTDRNFGDEDSLFRDSDKSRFAGFLAKGLQGNQCLAWLGSYKPSVLEHVIRFDSW